MLDGRELGALPAGRYKRLEAALAAGFPVTCQLRVLRQPDRPARGGGLPKRARELLRSCRGRVSS